MPGSKLGESGSSIRGVASGRQGTEKLRQPIVELGDSITQSPSLAKTMECALRTDVPKFWMGSGQVRGEAGSLRS